MILSAQANGPAEAIPDNVEMEKRARLIHDRAQELFARDHPGQKWPAASEESHTAVLALQGHYLALAEDQLLAEGIIECVDQS